LPLTPGQIVNTLAPLVGKVGAAGIAGNLMQESSDNPADQGGGLAQWQGSRYTGLVKYAQSRGLPTTSAQAALGYLAQDLKGPYSSLAQQLRQSPNPQHAADLFSNIYERPGIPMIQNRERYAQQALGSKGGSLGASLSTMPGMPGPQGSTQTTTSTVPTFNQAGFDQARARSIAGNYLAQSAKNNPYKTASSSSLIAPGLLTTKAPNPADYQGTKTIQDVTHTLQQLAGTPLVNIHPGAQGYINPIPGAVIGRTDMGVDANLKPGAPIRAIGDSRVVGIMPNWYNGQPYLALQLTSGPRAGQNYYVAEQINPQVRVGQTVKAGQPIATYANSGTGIEIGWAGKNWQQTQAQESGNTGDPSHGNAPAGVNFRSFLGGLK
jgi:murein DD-endopeptidase MepM/ murein hydrolase activator NlpD